MFFLSCCFSQTFSILCAFIFSAKSIMLPQITAFVIKHCPLVALFFAVLILIIIEEAKSNSARGERVSPATATHLINRDNAVVIDLRDATAFRDGHIVNAKNIALADFDHNQEKLNA